MSTARWVLRAVFPLVCAGLAHGGALELLTSPQGAIMDSWNWGSYCSPAPVCEPDPIFDVMDSLGSNSMNVTLTGAVGQSSIASLIVPLIYFTSTSLPIDDVVLDTADYPLVFAFANPIPAIGMWLEPGADYATVQLTVEGLVGGVLQTLGTVSRTGDAAFYIGARWSDDSGLISKVTLDVTACNGHSGCSDEIHLDSIDVSTPEPGSAGMLLGGIVLLSGLISRRIRKPRG